MPLDMLVIYGSVRTARQGIRAARFVRSRLEARGHAVTLVDPLEYPLPLLDRMYKEYEPGTAPEPMERLAGHIRRCDAVVVVTGEYNHAAPPALLNLLDHFLEEWRYRPSGIVCYSAGSFGGVRAAVQLRATLAEIGISSIPSMQPIPKVQSAFEEDGTPIDEAWYRRTDTFFAELEWYAEALKAQREKGLPT